MEQITVNFNKRIKDELNESMDQLEELFHIAYDLNQSENTRTAFSQKTTTYLSGIIQTLQYVDGQLGECYGN